MCIGHKSFGVIFFVPPRFFSYVSDYEIGPRLDLAPIINSSIDLL